jgi:serine/threonine protein kinase
LKETPPRARQSVNLSASSSGRSAGSDEPLPGSPSASGGDRPPPRGGVQRRKSVSDLGTGLSVVRETIALQKLVGKGGFSRVFHVKATARTADGAPIPGRDFVLKLIPIRKLVKSGVEHTVRHERDLLSSVRHASVVRLHTAFKAMDHIYLIMDLVTGRDFYWIMQHYNLSDAGARFYIAQIVMVLEYLHKLSIAYRDVKPENFIVTTKDGYLRMIDFGLSKLLGPGERSYTFCGTPLYLAPEVWGSNGHNRSVDLWALGVLTYEMAFGKLPFEAKSESELKQKVVGDALKFPREIGSFGNDEIDPRLKSLIMGLLEKNSTRRLGMSKEGTKAVRSSAWFKDLDWHAIEKRKLAPPFYPRPENEREAAAKLTAADSELVPPTSADCPRYGDRFPDF